RMRASAKAERRPRHFSNLSWRPHVSPSYSLLAARFTPPATHLGHSLLVAPLAPSLAPRHSELPPLSLLQLGRTCSPRAEALGYPMLRRLLLAYAVVGSPLLAQNAPPTKPAHLQGQVVDTAGRPIRPAIVETDDPPKAVVSDDSGFFRFADLPAGPITVRVRRLGFEGVEFQLRLPSDSTVSIGVKQIGRAHVLEAVQIDAGAEAAHPQLALTGFYQRMRAGWGHMVTPEEIDKKRKLAPGASSFLQDIVGVT